MNICWWRKEGFSLPTPGSYAFLVLPLTCCLQRSPPFTESIQSVLFLAALIVTERMVLQRFGERAESPLRKIRLAQSIA